MTTWTKITKASGTGWTKIAKAVDPVTSTGGTPIGLLLALTYANTTDSLWTKITKASNTTWTKITKAS